MVQMSKIERLTLYEPLKVLLYKEVLSHCHEIAGSIPSIVNSSLQDFCKVFAKRKNEVHNGKIQWVDPCEFKGKSEVIVVANTTNMRYFFNNS